ncbi:plant UBX domain-containing protein 4-like [Cucurbita pepo subsp. pepo]|uniref:plant UBX domain-containing protein 4-like n=1 Tax=Cucurbita pepo subsp. pepo TaxID=3664 RepID=UPI000C9D55F4|nr:plant UBX domain-containing protein 4-like [Cucurbita pepo subsp. pepo]XP_023533786.1 plant UBX domain-containing protein 4-like [Cucurbita pepo subsp. pepo]
MEAEAPHSKPQDDTANAALINSFIEITSSSKAEALFFLESHNWDLDAAVSTFLDNHVAVTHPVPPPDSPEFSPSQSPSRSRSPSPPASRVAYELRSRRARGEAEKKVDTRASGSRTRGIRTISDLNRPAEEDSDSDSDDIQEYYTGGEKSGMLVQDPSKGNSVDAIFDQARQSAVSVPIGPPSASKSFTGTARLLSGETVPSIPRHPEAVTHTVTFWGNGFSVDDGPLRRLDDPENAPFLESIRRSECPVELEPADRRTSVHVNLVRREDDYPEPVKRRHALFQGVGRTLASDSLESVAAEQTSASISPNAAPSPSTGLVVDDSLPITSLQLRLSDGTRMVSRFNHHHTIRDIRGFIDASRPSGARNYQLQTMGFPPKQLVELDQTIEQAGIANSVVIQKF